MLEAAWLLVVEMVVGAASQAAAVASRDCWRGTCDAAVAFAVASNSGSVAACLVAVLVALPFDLP